jgi:ATP-dependent Clp protease protease subunit
MIKGEVNDDMYDIVLKNLHALDSTVGTINIILNSNGGDVVSGLAIFDAINNCQNHVRITVYGEASSSASFILQAADERVLSKNSRIMIHFGQEAYGSDHPRNVKAAYEWSRHEEALVMNIYLKRIKQKKKRYTLEDLTDIMVFDRYLSPKECLDLGLIDVILE